MPIGMYFCLRFDFLVVGYVKDVYANITQTLNQMNANIRNAIVEILPEMCWKIIENYLKSIVTCKTSSGAYLNDIVFQV